MITDRSIIEDLRRVARTYYGPIGIWLYDAFEAINREWFDDELPYPLITLAITPHSRCLGLTYSTDAVPPNVILHPSIFGGTESDDPWGIGCYLGRRYAFDVLTHELMHVSVNYLLGGRNGGESSHNNPSWVAEVNRLAPLLGLKDVEAAESKPKRVPIPNEFTKTGRPRTKLKRVTTGNVPFKAVSDFPHGVRKYFGQDDYYRNRNGELPLQIG